MIDTTSMAPLGALLLFLAGSSGPGAPAAPAATGKADPMTLLAEGRATDAARAAEGAIRAAPGDVRGFLARGLADAALLRAEARGKDHRGPRACDGARLGRLVDDLAAGLLAGDASTPATVLDALEELALVCRDPGSFAALTSAIVATHPDARGSRREVELDKAPGGLSGATILRAVATELSDVGMATPALARRAQYRWMIEEWHRVDRRFIHKLEAQRLCRALLAVGLGIERTGAGAGVVLGDLALVARVGGLHYLPVVDPASAWVPWLATAKLSAVELGQLRELESTAAEHQDAPGNAVFVFKLRAVLALREEKPCARARGIAAAINSLAATAQEIDRARITGLVKDAAERGLEAVNQCPDGGFLLHRELVAVLRRIGENGQPFPVAYDFVEP
jgi:hypothetical protein